jgi:hypothetical protein
VGISFSFVLFAEFFIFSYLFNIVELNKVVCTLTFFVSHETKTMKQIDNLLDKIFKILLIAEKILGLIAKFFSYLIPRLYLKMKNSI